MKDNKTHDSILRWQYLPSRQMATNSNHNFLKGAFTVVWPESMSSMSPRQHQNSKTPMYCKAENKVNTIETGELMSQDQVDRP